jgi:protein-tyrosine phosphatase
LSIGLSTTTGAPATDHAIAQAAAQGLDLSEHRATNLPDYAYEPGDVLLVMELRHAHALVAKGIPAHAISPLGLWATPRRLHLHDPHTLSAAYFATCFTLIESAVRALLQARRQVQS